MKLNVPKYEQQAGLVSTPAANISNVRYDVSAATAPAINAPAAAFGVNPLPDILAAQTRAQQVIDNAQVFTISNSVDGEISNSLNELSSLKGMDIVGSSARIKQQNDKVLESAFNNCTNDFQKMSLASSLLPKVRAINEHAEKIEAAETLRWSNEQADANITNSINQMATITDTNLLDANLFQIAQTMATKGQLNGWSKEVYNAEFSKVIGPAIATPIVNVLKQGDTAGATALLRKYQGLGLPANIYTDLNNKIQQVVEIDKVAYASSKAVVDFGTTPQGQVDAENKINTEYHGEERNKIISEYRQNVTRQISLEKQQQTEATKQTTAKISEWVKAGHTLPEIQRFITTMGLDPDNTNKMTEIADRLYNNSVIGMDKTVNGGKPDVGTVAFLSTKQDLTEGDATYAYNNGSITGSQYVSFLSQVKTKGDTVKDNQVKSQEGVAFSMIETAFTDKKQLDAAKNALLYYKGQGETGEKLINRANKLVIDSAKNDISPVKAMATIDDNYVKKAVLTQRLGNPIGTAIFEQNSGMNSEQQVAYAAGLGLYTDSNMTKLAKGCIYFGMPITMANMKIVSDKCTAQELNNIIGG